jgi:hypothetical protein
MAQDNTLARSLHGRGAVLLAGNKGRLATQRGVAGATVAKAALTAWPWAPRPIRGPLANG